MQMDLSAPIAGLSGDLSISLLTELELKQAIAQWGKPSRVNTLADMQALGLYLAYRCMQARALGHRVVIMQRSYGDGPSGHEVSEVW